MFLLLTLNKYFRVFFSTLSEIYGLRFFAKIVNGQKSLTIFAKKSIEAATGGVLLKKENTCGRDFFLIKLQASGLQLYYKKDPGTCFPVNFVKFLRATFLRNTSG